jgi:hypothetical protein
LCQIADFTRISPLLTRIAHAPDCADLRILYRLTITAILPDIAPPYDLIRVSSQTEPWRGVFPLKDLKFFRLISKTKSNAKGGLNLGLVTLIWFS